ncbi:hypothetical protein D4764_11G0003010 [Takifugu flavidus]|uniref:Uncharacterized protein n=1 Tax=Takifugu flavidus TaxID=433684 RepID=A0A5C6PIW8_9TELE|nr:hypothetical protein D4764_11G0003010 [Takifugu flavidus]
MSHQKEENTGTGRPSRLQPGLFGRQKLGDGRSLGKPWRKTIGQPLKDSSKPSGALGGGSSAPPTLYSAGRDLLTSTGDIDRWWKEYFVELLNPVVTASTEEVEAGDSKEDFAITLAKEEAVPLASLNKGLQYVLGRFAAECKAVGMKISTSKSRVMVLDRKREVCPLQVGGEVLPQLEQFR